MRSRTRSHDQGGSAGSSAFIDISSSPATDSRQLPRSRHGCRRTRRSTCCAEFLCSRAVRKRELEEISKIADEIDFPAGTTLIREQERGRQFIVVIDGSVEVQKKRKKVPIRGGAEFFGEIALISNSPTIATIITTTPVHALVITDRHSSS